MRKYAVPILVGAMVGLLLAVPVVEHRQTAMAKDETAAVIQQAADDHDADLGRITQLEAQVEILRRDNEALHDQLDDAKQAKVAAERRAEAAARASRSRRVALSTASSTPVGNVGGWAHSVRGIKIANCESADLQHWPYSDGTRYLGGEKGVHLRDPNGHYGKWQFDFDTWRSVGGSGNPADASEAEQDMRANLLHAQRGEQPWSCAHMV